MFGLILTLSGSILLAVMTAVRTKEDAERASITVLTIVESKSIKILDNLKEIYLFRMGLLYIILGTLLQIFEFDINVSDVNIFMRCAITISMTFLLLLVGKYISFKIAERKYEEVKSFNIHQ